MHNSRLETFKLELQEIHSRGEFQKPALPFPGCNRCFCAEPIACQPGDKFASTGVVQDSSAAISHSMIAKKILDREQKESELALMESNSA